MAARVDENSVWDKPEFAWSDDAYFTAKQAEPHYYKRPMNIYEVHLSSFRAGLTYRDLANELVDYVVGMGYTHIELIILAEHTTDINHDYLPTALFAPLLAPNEPEGLMQLINRAHNKGIGVILGFEYKLDYSTAQENNFLLANAIYWLEVFHIDALHISCAEHMHCYGDFLKGLSSRIRDIFANNDRLTIIDDSSNYPLPTASTENCPGFHLIWNKRWMDDTLYYMNEEPSYRKWHHNRLTYPLCNAFSERFILPLPHAEISNRNCSLIGKLPGDTKHRFGQLRLLLAYQFAHPGKKLNFMGNEFGLIDEWNPTRPLDWMLLSEPNHNEMLLFSRELNMLYKSSPPLFERDADPNGFAPICIDDSARSVLIFLRWDDRGSAMLCAFNFSDEPRASYRIRMPISCTLTEAFSTDEERFGGSGKYINTKPIGVVRDAKLSMPPLSAVFFTLTDIAPLLEQASGE